MINGDKKRTGSVRDYVWSIRRKETIFLQEIALCK